MNTREVAGEYRLSYWAEVVQQRIQSGLTIKAFCEQEGIHENTYFYWQRKLREAVVSQVEHGSRSLSPATKETQLQKTTDSKAMRPSLTGTTVPHGWTQVQRKWDPDPDAIETLPINIGMCRILVNKDTNLVLLEKVCRMLVSIC